MNIGVKSYFSYFSLNKTTESVLKGVFFTGSFYFLYLKKGCSERYIAHKTFTASTSTPKVAILSSERSPQ